MLRYTMLGIKVTVKIIIAITVSSLHFRFTNTQNFVKKQAKSPVMKIEVNWTSLTIILANERKSSHPILNCA